MNTAWDEPEQNPRENVQKRVKSLCTLIEFAADMMIRLNEVNRDSFQEFQLRVGKEYIIHFEFHELVPVCFVTPCDGYDFTGLATGMTVAGVVGT